MVYVQYSVNFVQKAKSTVSCWKSWHRKAIDPSSPISYWTGWWLTFFACLPHSSLPLNKANRVRPSEIPTSTNRSFWKNLCQSWKGPRDVSWYCDTFPFLQHISRIQVPGQIRISVPILLNTTVYIWCKTDNIVLNSALNVPSRFPQRLQQRQQKRFTWISDSTFPLNKNLLAQVPQRNCNSLTVIMSRVNSREECVIDWIRDLSNWLSRCSEYLHTCVLTVAYI